MGKRGTQPIENDERGNETHPAFAMVRAARVSATPGAVLFDSDLRHQHYITLSISTATRKRELKRDWIHSSKDLIEVSMTEAQWAQMVSSMNTTGTPATLTFLRGEGLIPGLEYEPRMQVQLDELRNSITEALSSVDAALADYEAHPTKAKLRHLRAMLDGVPRNITYTAQALAEHTENVVTKARADIEAMVAHAKETHNVEIDTPADLLIIESGNEGDTE